MYMIVSDHIYIYIYICLFSGHWHNRAFANGLGDWVQSQVESYQRLKKWYLLPSCL